MSGSKARLYAGKGMGLAVFRARLQGKYSECRSRRIRSCAFSAYLGQAK